MASFLSKRYLGDDQPVKKLKKGPSPDSNTVLETNPMFKAVYRDLIATGPATAETATVEGLSWLADLQAATADKCEETVLEEAPVKTVTAENFWRPEKLEADFHEQRSFVRSDGKAQLQATKRKLKLRLFT